MLLRFANELPHVKEQLDVLTVKIGEETFPVIHFEKEYFDWLKVLIFYNNLIF